MRNDHDVIKPLSKLIINNCRTFIHVLQLKNYKKIDQEMRELYKKIKCRVFMDHSVCALYVNWQGAFSRKSHASDRCHLAVVVEWRTARS